MSPFDIWWLNLSIPIALFVATYLTLGDTTFLRRYGHGHIVATIYLCTVVIPTAFMWAAWLVWVAGWVLVKAFT